MSPRPYRPNPRVATARVVAGLDVSNEEAIDRMREQLARAWESGHFAGWDDGVADATEDDAMTTRNPYEPRSRR